MDGDIRFGTLSIDCPDAALLCRFYAGLLRGRAVERYGCPAVVPPEGPVLLFMQEEDFVPCVWPEAPGEQQKQIHIDFQVPDVPAAVARAEALGAIKAPAQFGGADFVTMLDPAGHPFCLCRAD